MKAYQTTVEDTILHGEAVSGGIQIPVSNLEL